MEANGKICVVCNFEGRAQESALVFSNVRRFRTLQFPVWRCRRCRSLHGPELPNIDEFYADYPIRKQKLDYFFRIWLRNILGRLQRIGFTKEHTLIDYGCNTGLWLTYLRSKGIKRVQGFDLYVSEYRQPAILSQKYDWVYSADVIEHVSNPKDFLAHLKELMKPDGKLVILTPNAEGIDLGRSDEFLHSLHQPFHTHILSKCGLSELGRQLGLTELAVDDRWYMDSWWPATSRRFIERLLSMSGNVLDTAYEPLRVSILLKNPSRLCGFFCGLLVDLFFGYFFWPKKKDHMMIVFKFNPEKQMMPPSK
jgi:SAM-dependent methyltransferase